MSFWTDPIVIPPLTLAMFAIGFFTNKIIEIKTGKRMSDLERLDYMTDLGVNQSMKYGAKIKGTLKALKQDSIPEPIYKDAEAIEAIMEVEGKALSEMQLTLDHMAHVIKKITDKFDDLDYNNGDNEIENKGSMASLTDDTIETIE